MAKLHEMLACTEGSFPQAEKVARGFVAQGQEEARLDLSLLLGAQGKFKEAVSELDAYANKNPGCPRLRFSKAAYALREGNLAAGLDYVEAGRIVNCIGSTSEELAKIPAPRWDGKAPLKGKTVLWYGEGGDGDHIMCARSAKWLSDMGATVLAACPESLLGLFSRITGVTVALGKQAVPHVKCDFYVPAMSSFALCKRTWENLWTGPYVERPQSRIWERIIPIVPYRRNVAIRWKGSPKFEHEQFRVFPPELLFATTRAEGVDRWSVQKSDRQTIVPGEVVDLEPLLGNWEQTAAVLARCDLVVTSDTAIGHLAAAMGFPTWIIVPIMPYWPWARLGDLTPWYPTVRLFRQEKFGTWKEPFEKLGMAFRGWASDIPANPRPQNSGSSSPIAGTCSGTGL